MSKVWTAKDVEYLQVIAQDVISLNTLIGNPEDGNECELGDMVLDPRPGPEDRAISDSTKELLLKIIKKTLSPREEKVIRMRYGFETGNSMTLDEVGKKYGVTRERIRQVEACAIDKIKKKLEKLNIKEGDI